MEQRRKGGYYDAAAVSRFPPFARRSLSSRHTSYTSLTMTEVVPTPAFPAYRPRRLRRTAALRRLVRETHLAPSQLVLPLFVRSGRQLRQPVGSMPGVCQTSVDEMLRDAA